MSDINLWKKDLYRDDINYRGLQKVANQMFSNFFRERDVCNALLPTCDFYETENSYNLSMELPGISKDDIDVSVSGDILKIKGEKKYEKESRHKRKYYCLERSYGSFYRSVNLPSDANKDNIAVNFTNGVLEVTIQKLEQSSVKKIEIR